MSNNKVLMGREWAAELLKALGLEGQRNRRIIIDCEAGQPVKIYLENFGTERLWNVRMPPFEIVEVVKHSTEEPS